MASIELTKVSLSYPVHAEGHSLRKNLVRLSTGGIIDKKNNRVTVEALREIDLKLKEGDRVGLTGHNGSGKSTFLKLLGGIYKPSSGKLKISGGTRSLFELGIGVDPELTGYSNIDRISRLYGYNPRQVRTKLKDVEEFTELGGYLDLPMSTYSAGMRLRLIFSVATMFPADILLIDEVFGVGDSAFHEKAKKRMEDLVKESKIVVLASHSTELINSFCSKTLMFENGQIKNQQALG